MTDASRIVVGTQPWLPAPLRRSPAWTTPVPAERLAALRIGVAGVLLVDLCTSFAPNFTTFFGAGSLGAPPVFAATRGSAAWSLLTWTDDPIILRAVFVVWVLAAAGLLVGLGAHFCAFLCWALALSFQRLNPAVHNAGDAIRIITLFVLIFCPCGAAWSLDARLAAPRAPAAVAPWPIRLLLVQMTIVYFLNGLTKCFGPDWRDGSAMHYVLTDLSLMRWSPATLPAPAWLVPFLSWLPLAWELSFPLALMRRWTRRVALVFGAAFHLATLIFMDLGAFPLNMLCLYLPLLPWERAFKTAARVPPNR